MGIDRPAELTKDDDEFDAYRKRMMLAYRFRPNPLVSKYSVYMQMQLVYYWAGPVLISGQISFFMRSCIFLPCVVHATRIKA